MPSQYFPIKASDESHLEIYVLGKWEPRAVHVAFYKANFITYNNRLRVTFCSTRNYRGGSLLIYVEVKLVKELLSFNRLDCKRGIIPCLTHLTTLQSH